MIALSIRQPWATLIVTGRKNIENRTWKTDVRGRIYIHASRAKPKNFKNLCERHDLTPAALVFGKITTESFSETTLKDERIWSVINKIKGKASKEFEDMFPQKQPSRITVKTYDGKTYSEYLEFPKGDPRNPMTMEDLTNKFDSLTQGLITPKRKRQIKDTIFSCENMSAQDFMESLVVE